MGPQSGNEAIANAHEKYKIRHGCHHMDKLFAEGDCIWLYPWYEVLKGKEDKIKPGHCGPFIVIKCITQMHINFTCSSIWTFTHRLISVSQATRDCFWILRIQSYYHWWMTWWWIFIVLTKSTVLEGQQIKTRRGTKINYHICRMGHPMHKAQFQRW